MAIHINTERLILREFVPEDAPALIEVCKQPHIEYWLPDYREYHIHASGWIDMVRRNYEIDDPRVKFISLAIEHRESGKLIGQIGIGSGDYGVGLGYFLSDEYTSHGLMTEATRAMVDYAFGRYGYAEIIATVQPANIPSMRVVEKLGFAYQRTVVYLENGHECEKPFRLYSLPNPAKYSATAAEWDADSDDYFSGLDALYDRVEREPANGFPQAVLPMIRRCLPDMNGANVLVPSCGDNIAVCAFWAMGARVTAMDLSPRQIANARQVAERRGWTVSHFLCDSMSLDAARDGEYDLVYTSNGVHVWISDLPAMYRNIYRALKPGGHYVLFDTHPVVRPFDASVYDGVFQVRKPYEDVGPFDGGTEYGWRTMDYVNALVSAGFEIVHMDEFHSAISDCKLHNYLYRDGDEAHDNFDWHVNPWAALPQCLGFCVRKPTS